MSVNAHRSPDNPPADDVRSFAQRHGLTEDQARRVLEEHGSDESAWGDAARSLLHFLKAPS